MTADQLPGDGTTPEEALSKEKEVKRRLSAMLDDFTKTFVRPVESVGIINLSEFTLINPQDKSRGKFIPSSFNTSPTLVMNIDFFDEEENDYRGLESYWINADYFSYGDYTNPSEKKYCDTKHDGFSSEKVALALKLAEERLAGFLAPIKAAQAEREGPRPQVQTDFYE